MSKQVIVEKIQNSLNKIRPALQMDGGDLEFVDFDEKNGELKIKLLGMCSGCAMATLTLKDGIEVEVKKDVPEVQFITRSL